ncbi:protein kinase, putative, partial [Entamoeba invadens IP1]
MIQALFLIVSVAYYCDDTNGVFSEKSTSCTLQSGVELTTASSDILIFTNYISTTVVLNDFNHNLQLGTSTTMCTLKSLTIISNTLSTKTYNFYYVDPSLKVYFDSDASVYQRIIYLSSFTLPSKISNLNTNKLPFNLFLYVDGLQLPETNSYLLFEGSFSLITSYTREYFGYLFSSNSNDIQTSKNGNNEIVSVDCINGFKRYYAFFSSMEHQLTCTCSPNAINDKGCKVISTYSTTNNVVAMMAMGDQNIYRKDANFETEGDVGYINGIIFVYLFNTEKLTVKNVNGGMVLFFNKYNFQTEITIPQGEFKGDIKTAKINNGTHDTLYLESNSPGGFISIQQETFPILFRGKDGTVIETVNNYNNFVKNNNCEMSTMSLTNPIKCITCPPEKRMNNGICECLYTTSGMNCVLNYCSVFENGICRQCDANYYYDETSKMCKTCGENCEKCVNNTYCYKCNTNTFIIKNGVCLSNNCLYSNNGNCFKCAFGYYISGGECAVCNIEHCDVCTSKSICSICQEGFYWDGTSCINSKGFVNQNNKLLYCKSSQYYLKEDLCNTCSEILPNCEMCMDGKCIKCLDNTIYTNGYCLIESSCNFITNNKCICNTETLYNGSACIPKRENCLFDRLSGCDECSNSYHLIENNCTTVIQSNCTIESSSNCVACDFGMYINEYGLCVECPSECTSCLNSEKCITCLENRFLQEHECLTSDELSAVCDKPLPNGQGCAFCKSGYYRSGDGCKVCNEGCATCTDNINCITCQSDYFMTYNEGVCKLQNTTNGCSSISVSLGCTTCISGYYLYHRECERCENNCVQCTSTFECQKCENGLILINSNCKSMSSVKECLSVTDGKCSKCTFWHSPSENGTYCTTQAEWWVILIIIISLILLIIIIILIVYFFTKRVLEKIHLKAASKSITLFEMKRSNISFTTLQGGICVSSKEINFNAEKNEIPVEQETREILCVGNTNKAVMKIQFTLSSNNDKYEVRVEPEIVSLKNKFACEFSIYVTPFCTTKISGTLQIVSQNIKTNEENFNGIIMRGITEKTTRIDYDELEEEKKLGEGSFGIVYKGSFRGNVVAIKRLKHVFDDENSMDEFSNEVQMLNKFR